MHVDENDDVKCVSMSTSKQRVVRQFEDTRLRSVGRKERINKLLVSFVKQKKKRKEVQSINRANSPPQDEEEDEKYEAETADDGGQNGNIVLTS